MEATLWEIKWGPELKILKQSYDNFGTVPPALQNRPRVREYLKPAFDAFKELHNRRKEGMQGVLPLEISEIREWGDVIGIRKGYMMVSFCRRVMACDNAYLKQIRG